MKPFFRKNLAEIIFVLLLLGFYLVNAMIGEYNDEWDNILSGKMMADGLILYRDIFSHHFPLPYVMSYVIHLIINPHFYSFRILFSLFLFTWALFLYVYTRTSPSRFPRKYFFLLLLAFVSPILRMNMLLAEVLVGYSALTILCIALYRPRPLMIRDLSLFVFFAFCIAASGMAYLPLALLAYLFVLFALLHDRLHYPWKRILFLAVFSFIPYGMTAAILITAGSLDDFLWQNITFNQVYYLPFLYDYPQSVLSFPIFILKNLAKATVGSLNITLANLENIIYFALLLMTATYVLHLIRKRSYINLCFFLGVFILSSARLATDTGIAHQGNVPFYMISLIAFAHMSSKIYYAFCDHLNDFPKNWTKAIGTIVIFLFFALTSLKVVDSYYLLTFAERRVQNGTQAAYLLNETLKPGETYWVGPYDFKTQYYLSSPPATRYTFYLPWHAKSEKVRKEMIEDFKRNQPKIIMLDGQFSVWIYPFSNYGQELTRYINENYSRFGASADGGTTFFRAKAAPAPHL